VTDYSEHFARFYDILYAKIRDDADNSYYIKKILAAKGHVLEAGAGTGRIFVNALNKGADIYGFDVSPAMIEVLKKKIPPDEHHRVWVDDIRSFKSPMRYSLILAPFRVFSHVLTVEDQLRALNNVNRHLATGGIFIFDLFVPNPGILAEGFDEVKDFDGEYAPGHYLRRFTTMDADVVNQISEVKMKFAWDEDGKEREETWETKMRYYCRYELEHLVALSDLSLDKICGDFADRPLNRDSKEFIVYCTKGTS
jgi:SAM-dependent methyltransferase